MKQDLAYSVKIARKSDHSHQNISKCPAFTPRALKLGQISLIELTAGDAFSVARSSVQAFGYDQITFLSKALIKTYLKDV
ncbi:hypothetical protein TNIN_332811 [Trichonephila inaurata madagascariensis]|uniref:Uncharacterized protein n=1 Tax=Trichonephila inaurata madagascariensis TaxID=2747483 RepID=A0A8X7BVV9_9ARAC|nr:hypothetical protein TNIN_332811 [Trichonephila inaurata madagascariensis]